MVIGDIEVYPGHPCPHSTGKGCDDYANRPIDPCDNFNCGWAMDNSPLPDWLKPSNSKAIVIFNKINWQTYPVDLAVPVGKKIPPRTLNWLKAFSEQHGRPLLYTEQLKQAGQFQKQQLVFAYGPEAFQQDVLKWQEEGRKLW